MTDTFDAQETSHYWSVASDGAGARAQVWGQLCALRAPTVKLQFFSLGQKVENYCFPQVFPVKCQSLNRRRNLARSGHPIGHPKLQSDLKVQRIEL
ncbi:hypothetical protein quinque_012840 [Culex quinquefasciatus]